MGLPPTYALTDAAVLDGLRALLGESNLGYVGDQLLVSADNLVFRAPRGNWLQAPAPVIFVNGAPAAVTLDYDAGTATFASAQDPTAIVTATYTAAVFDTTALTGFITRGFFRIEGQLLTSLDDMALPRGLFAPILAAAHIDVLYALIAARLDGYLWQIDGKRIDKRAVAQRWNETIKQREDRLAQDLVWLRAEYMGTGYNTRFNLDMGLPPDHFSHYRQDQP